MCFYVRIADGLVLSRQWNQLGLAMGALCCTCVQVTALPSHHHGFELVPFAFSVTVSVVVVVRL